MKLETLLQIIAPIIAAFLSVGGIGAYFSYRQNKPKTEAEAQRIEADVVVTFAEGWKQLAEKLESKVNKLEIDIAKLRQALDEQDEKYQSIIRTKDKEILDLQAKNDILEKRVDELELELAKYTNEHS